MPQLCVLGTHGNTVLKRSEFRMWIVFLVFQQSHGCRLPFLEQVKRVGHVDSKNQNTDNDDNLNFRNVVQRSQHGLFVL